MLISENKTELTRRGKMSAVFNRQRVERAPVSIRLDLWYNNAFRTGQLPEQLLASRSEEVEDYLGFCRAARFRSRPHINFKSIEIQKTNINNEITEQYLFANKTLTRKVQFTPDMTANGLSGHITEFPLKEKSDYQVMLENMEQAFVDYEIEILGFNEFDDSVGDSGLPMLIVDNCPAHTLMLFFAGYEAFYYHLSDFPELVDELIKKIETIFRRDLWTAICKTNAELVLHGAHFSSQMTPIPIFEKYFSPYFKEFIRLMHQHNKKVLWHADAEMRSLFNNVVKCEFDGADCLITAPLTNETIEDYFDAWQDKIVCWGGLPSIIFDPCYPMEQYKKYVNNLVEVTKNNNRFIFGTSDNVMPGAEWERLVYLAKATGTWSNE